jgi:hypothetical protein
MELTRKVAFNPYQMPKMRIINKEKGVKNQGRRSNSVAFKQQYRMNMPHMKSERVFPL